VLNRIVFGWNANAPRATSLAPRRPAAVPRPARGIVRARCWRQPHTHPEPTPRPGSRAGHTARTHAATPDSPLPRTPVAVKPSYPRHIRPGILRDDALPTRLLTCLQEARCATSRAPDCLSSATVGAYEPSSTFLSQTLLPEPSSTSPRPR
jgi:hypothetical protein